MVIDKRSTISLNDLFNLFKLFNLFRRIRAGTVLIIAALLVLMTTSLIGAPPAQAAINVDRTRIIMSSADKSISPELVNSEQTTPYLAQSWIENADGSRSNALIALPPLQRIDGGQKARVRILQIKSETNKLPADRESLFYFNVRGIPPKPAQNNVVQFTQQSRLKLFWRPVSLKKMQIPAGEQLKILQSHAGTVLQNPTAYYVTVVLFSSGGNKNLANFHETMIAPFAEQALPGVSFSAANIYVGYVDDFGGMQVVKYSCSAGRCLYSPASRDR